MQWCNFCQFFAYGSNKIRKKNENVIAILLGIPVSTGIDRWKIFTQNKIDEDDEIIKAPLYLIDIYQ